MDNCTQMQELISRLLDEELSAAEQSALAKHLESCPECRGLYEAFSAVSDTLREDLAEPPESLHENVMAELRREQMIKRNRRPWRTALSAVAAMALLVLGLRFVGMKRSASQLTAAARGMDAGAAQTETVSLAEDDAALFESEEEAPMESMADFAEADEAPAALQAAPPALMSTADADALPDAANSVQRSTAVAPTQTLDLRDRMDLAALLAWLEGEEAAPAPEGEAPDRTLRLLAADGVLELQERNGEWFYSDPESDAWLRAGQSPEELPPR